MKYVLVVGDGMADDPIPELGGKTPLQYANIPTPDKLAGSGVLGCAKTIPEGMQAGSDTALLSILGLNPREYYSGRAPLEAAATGIELSPGDVALRCNMVSVEDTDIPFENKKILSHSSGAIEGKDSDTLVTDLFNSPEFNDLAKKAGMKIYPGSSFRHIAVKRQGDGSSVLHRTENTKKLLSKSKTDEPSPCLLMAPHDHLDQPLGKYLPQGSDNAEVLKKLMQLSHEILNVHPINEKRRKEGKLPGNCIWFWAAGTAIKLPDFTEKYGKTGSVISAVPLCRGIGVLVGLEKIIVPGATGELNTNYEGKVEATIEALKTKDFAVLHIEAPDECTHNGDLKGKLQAIEWLDSRILAPLILKLNENKTDYRILFISDHRTLTSTRGHDSGLVPFVLYDSRIDKKTGFSFDEQNAVKTGLVLEGTKLMENLFSKQKIDEDSFWL